MRTALYAVAVLCPACAGCRAESDPSGVYVNNDAPADTLRLHTDGTTVRAVHVEGRRIIERGSWELDEDGRHIWLDE